MPKLARSLLVAVVVCAAAPALAVGPVRIVAPDPGSPYNIGTRPSIVPTDRGFAVVWWREADYGEPGWPFGRLHFARFDADGHRIGDETAIPIDTPYPILATAIDLEAIRKGYVAFVQDDAAAAYAVHLDAGGKLTAPAATVAVSDEMYPLAVASNGNTMAMTYPEWNLTWLVRAVEVDADGKARGDRKTVDPGRISPDGDFEGFVLDSPVAVHGSGFVTAWFRDRTALYLRELSNHAAPIGDIETLDAASGPFRAVAVASNADLTWVAYSLEDDGNADLYLVLRDSRGLVTSPIVLAASDRVEGYDAYYDIAHPVRATAAGDRAAVLYVDENARPLPPDLRIRLLEVDAAGAPLGPARDLTAEFGLDPWQGPSLRWDGARGRYVVAWSGDGPEGLGVYFLALEPAP